MYRDNFARKNIGVEMKMCLTTPEEGDRPATDLEQEVNSEHLA